MVGERLFQKIVGFVSVLQKYSPLTSAASERFPYVPGSGQQNAFIETVLPTSPTVTRVPIETPCVSESH